MAGLRHGLVEFKMEDVKCWGEASDTIVREERECAADHSYSYIQCVCLAGHTYTDVKATCFFHFGHLRGSFGSVLDGEGTRIISCVPVSLNPIAEERSARATPKL